MDIEMNPWFRIANDATLLMWDAQRVMALRLMGIAVSGSRTTGELENMVSEKVTASAEAGLADVGLAREKSAPAIDEKVPIKKRVTANHRRLTGKKKLKSRKTRGR
jgi:hypothetical protein